MGWHLPSKDEWIHLIENPTFSPFGLDRQAFVAEDAAFYSVWSSTEYSKDTVLIWTDEEHQSLYQGYLKGMSYFEKAHKNYIGEVHCVRDEAVCPPMKDYDGNTYSTIVIGKQCWTAENLRTTHDRNGKLISLGKDASSIHAYRYPPMRNEDHVGQYGYLYNYPAAATICPKGWHLPSNEDWEQLFMELGNTNRPYWGDIPHLEGGKSIASKDGWSEADDRSSYGDGDPVGYHPERNNSTGFNARPAGAYTDGIYLYFGDGACFWSTIHSNEYDASLGMVWLDYQFAGIGTDLCDGTEGLSVRCVRD